MKFGCLVTIEDRVHGVHMDSSTLVARPLAPGSLNIGNSIGQSSSYCSVRDDSGDSAVVEVIPTTSSSRRLSFDIAKGYTCVGYISSALVVSYANRIDLHWLLNNKESGHASIAISSECSVAYFTGPQHSMLSPTLLLRITSPTAPASNESLHIEWITINITALKHAMNNNNTVKSNDIVPLQTMGKLTSHPLVLSACSAGLPGSGGNGVGSDVWSVAYGTVTAASLRSIIHKGSMPACSGTVLLAVHATVDGKLLCFAGSELLWSRKLPSIAATVPSQARSAATEGAEIDLQFTVSAQTPLLLVSIGTTLLVLDVLNHGTVLREFVNVGAYSLATLLHPLQQQLLILPVAQVRELNLTAISNGSVLTRTTTASRNSLTTTNGTCCQHPSMVIADWFLCELPVPPRSSSVQIYGENQPLICTCKSLDAHGLWREDNKLVVDAQTYNNVQWRPLPSETSTHAPTATPPQAHHHPGPTSAFDASLLGKRAAEGGGEGDGRDHTDSQRTAQPVHSILAAASSSSSNNNTPKGQSDLAAQLTAHNHSLQPKIEALQAQLRFKTASVNFLRSLAVTRSSPPGISIVENFYASSGGRSAGTDASAGSRLCVNAEAGAEARSVHLQRLKTAQQLLHAENRIGNSDGRRSAQHDSLGEDGDFGSPILPVPGPSPGPNLVVQNLEYTVISYGQCIEISATVDNADQQNAAYLVRVVGWITPTKEPAHRATVVSGVAEKIDPGQTVRLVACLRMPDTVWMEDRQVVVRIELGLCWRELPCCAEGHPEHSGQSGNIPMEIANGSKPFTSPSSAAERLRGKVVDVVLLSLAELNGSIHNHHVSSAVAATIHRRQHLATKYNHTNRVGGVLLATCAADTILPPAAENVNTPVFTCRPSVMLKITSPLYGQIQPVLTAAERTWPFLTNSTVRELRSALLMQQSSGFSMEAVITNLASVCSARVGTGMMAVEMKANDSSEVTRISIDSEGRYSAQLRLQAQSSVTDTAVDLTTARPADVLEALRAGVERVGVLQVGSGAVAPLLTLQRAVVWLRAQLPVEVNLSIAPALEASE